MPLRAKKAIVIGGSMSGLMAARALSDHFESVVVIERDVLPDLAAPRKGVPQGRHAHGLLAAGTRTLEAMFPAFRDDVLGEGGFVIDTVADCRWVNFGAVLASAQTDLEAFLVSRPTLERAVRRRVAGLPNVTLRGETDGLALLHDSGRGRVTGLVVRTNGSPGEETLEADLVVDASGRGSRSPAWLERLGYSRPEEETMRIEVAYTTRHFRLRPGKTPDKPACIINAGAPLWRLAASLKQDGDRWVVTLGGSFGDRAPTDEAGFLEFAKSLPDPWAYNLIKDAEAIGEAASYSIPASVRRRYEKMTRFPDGFLVIGDAICSFNPIYGQGMSTAAKEALLLDECLAKGHEGLARRFFQAAGRVIDAPWQIAASADLANPKVDGARPAPVRFLNWYVERLFQAGSRDARLAALFLEVANLVRPPTAMLTPVAMWRVWRAHASRSRGVPAMQSRTA